MHVIIVFEDLPDVFHCLPVLWEQYEEFFVEWWEYYYDYVKKAMPQSHADYRLEEADDPTGMFAKWNPAKGCNQ